MSVFPDATEKQNISAERRKCPLEDYRRAYICDSEVLDYGDFKELEQHFSICSLCREEEENVKAMHSFLINEIKGKGKSSN